MSGDGAPAITVRRPTLIEGLSDDEERHMPSFNSPSPSPDLPPAEHSPSGGQYRPKLETNVSQSHSPLLGDISAAATPTSPLDNPFDSYRMGGTSPSVSPAPIEGAGPPPMSSTSSSPPHEYEDYAEGPFRNHASGSSSSGGSHDAEKVAAAAATATGNNRASLAPTEKSTATSTGRAAPMTAAERRLQRMSKITNRSKNSRQSARPAGQQMSRKAFQSTRLKEEIYKPWLEKKDPAMRWARWITIGSIILGVAIMGVLCWDGYNSIPKLGNLCPVLNEDWSNGLDTTKWQREVRTDGFGHGAFSWTTPFDNNSYVEDGVLYIVPHLTSNIIGEDAISNGYTLNLTADGRCTSKNVSQCVAVSNSSQLTVINPVTTARLVTRNSASIKYGKVEIVAKMPLGDWLWPSVMMLPVDETYGEWPRSGEIDIITSRGNNASYPQRGVDYAQSSLHWGPTTDLDRLYLTWGYREQRRSAYNEAFHTYGLEWNENYMWTYIDSRVSQVISLRFNKQSFWQRGQFPATYSNRTSGDIVRLNNPWINSGNNVAPFDQKFYLALDLTVGATDGWFPDGEGQKPWLDSSLSAMSDFWIARDKWWNRWSTDPKVRGFAIKSVKMSEVC